MNLSLMSLDCTTSSTQHHRRSHMLFNNMEEGDVLVPKPCTMAPLWVHFGFRPYDKEGPSNVEEAICKTFRKKVQVKSANLINLKKNIY